MEDGGTDRPGRARGRRAPAALALLAAACWAGAWTISALPEVDDQGRHLLRIWHLTSRGWTAVLVCGGAVGTIAAAALVVLRLPWHRLRPVQRTVLGLVAALAWAGLAGSLVLVAGWSAVLADGGPRQVLVGPDGARVLLTQDPFDGDVVDLWQPRDAVTWVREPGPVTVHPREGPCRLALGADLTRVVLCGAHGQPLGPPPD